MADLRGGLFGGALRQQAVAPVQVVVIPVSQHKEGVLEKASELVAGLSKTVRVKMDDSDKSPGWKFSEYEMKGVPIRLEIGPKDIEKGQVVLVRRDTREKSFVPIDELEAKVTELLDSIHNNLLSKAAALRDEKTYTAVEMPEFERIISETPGFIKAMWCGDRACEEAIKEKTGATSRCIPFDEKPVSDKCICCGKEAKSLVYWGKAY
jgi:prolyl-tRNA synthetase